MGFSESQLETWSNQGATTSSATTYNSIKTCLEQINWKSDITAPKIYLQGSYKNSTNIRANSDVDVVIEFTSVYYSNKGSFTPTERSLYDADISPSKYKLTDFRTAVLNKLKAYYGDVLVTDGNKAIKIGGANGRLDADVVCCCTYKKYSSYTRFQKDDYIEGIQLTDQSTSKNIISYPNLHHKNGASKNTTCNNNYKPTTRIIKKLKSNLIDRREIFSSIAPSYFIECLMYNVPNVCFQKTNHQDRTYAVLEFLARQDANSIKDYKCQNDVTLLFGQSEQQWNIDDCLSIIGALVNYWNEI